MNSDKRNGYGSFSGPGLRPERAFSLLLDLTVTALAAVGCVLSWRHQGAGMLIFYTVDSNLLGALACGISAFFILRLIISGRAVPAWVHTLKYVASCCLAVTFLVVILVLAPMGGAGSYRAMLLQGEMLYHHLLCPLLILLSFLLFDPVPVSRGRAAALALLPTAAYASAAILLNLMRVMEGPYPFLLVYEQPVWASVLWCALILGGAYAVAVSLRALQTVLGRGRQKRRPPEQSR